MKRVSKLISNSDLVVGLESRYAVKKFDPNVKVSEEDKETFKRALQLTATSYGLQPYKFLLVENKEIRERLLPETYGQRQVVDSSFLLVCCRRTDIAPDHISRYIDLVAKKRGVSRDELNDFGSMIAGSYKKMSDVDKVGWVTKQVYIALGNCLTTLALMGLDGCPIEGFNPQGYDEVLKLEEQCLKSVVLVAVGARAQDDDYQNRAKVRFDEQDLFDEI